MHETSIAVWSVTLAELIEWLNTKQRTSPIRRMSATSKLNPKNTNLVRLNTQYGRTKRPDSHVNNFNRHSNSNNTRNNQFNHMTTPAAAKLYEAQHVYEWESKGWAVHNPHNKPKQDLPVIYGFNNGGSGDWWLAALMSEDGTYLGDHTCSSEAYMPADLGLP